MNPLKKCNSEALYYGFKNPPDYTKARECALIKNHYDVLTMIYANGKGVKPDLNVALHYACMMDDAAPAEMTGRISHLNKLKEQKISNKDFDICDDITSGYMMGMCASLSQNFEEEKQKKYLDALKIKLTPLELDAFQKLQNASVNYFEARLDNEMDRRGTGAVAFGILEEMSLKERMITVLNKTMQCKLPAYNMEQYQKADNQLNFLYKKTQRKPDEEFFNITRNGIKNTERAWIKYKDAWVNFGQKKCPNISVESLKTLVTKERIKKLEELAM